MLLKRRHLYIIVFFGFLLAGCLVNPDDVDMDCKPTPKYMPIPKPLTCAYLHVGNRKLDLNSLKLDGVDIVNLAFTRINNSHVGLQNLNDASNFMIVRKLKKVYPRLKVVVSVGGYGTSDDFSKLCANPANISVFVEDAVRFMRYYDLDGMDVDWEFPGMDASTRDADRANFTTLISELRVAFDKASKQDSKKYLLTIAAGAFDLYLSFTEPEKIEPLVDYFYVMTYDFFGQWNKYTGHHTNIYGSNLLKSSHSVNRIVNKYLDAGIPSRKIVIGAAFYGRKWNDVDSKNNGIFRPGKGVGSVPYSKIVPLIKSGKYLRTWDTSALAPTLYNPDSKIFISYEDEESIARKVDYIGIHNLGGIMFWEYFSDYDSQLFNTVKKEMQIIKGQFNTLELSEGFSIKKR